MPRERRSGTRRARSAGALAGLRQVGENVGLLLLALALRPRRK